MRSSVLVAHGNTRALKQAVLELQLAGFDVVATPDGGDAFARFFEDQPQLVVCSAALPSLSGINFSRMVRAQSPETQVVILSTHSIYDVPSGAIVLGEPLSVADLRRVLPQFFSNEPEEATEPAIHTPVFVQAVLRRFERNSDMLRALDDAGLQSLADLAEHRSFGDGEQIIRQGERGDGFFLVVEGQVRVTLAERDDAQVARIGPGGFFGEMSLLHDQPRSASVWSSGPSTLLYFDKSRVLPLLERYPRVREVLSGVALQRTEDNLWSVLFDESEVDETLAELERGLQHCDVDPPEPAQARTTARRVERGEPLPDNDHTVEIKRIPVGPASASFDNEVTTPIGSEELARALEDSREREDPTVKLAAISNPSPKRTWSSSDTEEPRSRPSVRSRRSVVAFLMGTVSGFVIGVASVWYLDDHPAPIQAAQQTHSTSSPPAIQAIDDKPEANSETSRQTRIELEGREAETESDTSAQSTPQLQTALKPIPNFSPNHHELTPEQEATRKVLRRRLMAATEDQDWTQVLRLGEQLAKKYRLDWEAQSQLASAQRHLKRHELAISTYRHFVATYPTNRFATEARYWLGMLYVQRADHAKAKRLLERVAKSDDALLSERASEALRTLDATQRQQEAVSPAPPHPTF